jgi:hypothetical protein
MKDFDSFLATQRLLLFKVAFSVTFNSITCQRRSPDLKNAKQVIISPLDQKLKMFSYFFRKQAEPQPVEEWTILDQTPMQPMSEPPESLASSIISEIDSQAIANCNTLEKSV